MPAQNKSKWGKPWIATVKRNRKTYWLGSYDTREEAVEVEDAFKQANPGPGKAWPNSARKKSIEARIAKVHEQMAAERAKIPKRIPDPIIVGDDPESRQMRARLRAAKAIR